VLAALPCVDVRVLLETPAPACLAPPGVFDAFGWCQSDHLEWRRPASRWDDIGRLDGSDPARMVFVMRRPCSFLPWELARLHAIGLGLTDEVALAPWAIDDATDELYARRMRPRDVLWLAADNLNALFWGLHDWAHFHSHGPFEERAWTELQCDATALAWLWVNRDVVRLEERGWERIRLEAEALSRARFAAENMDFDARQLEAGHVQGLCSASGPPAGALVDAPSPILMLRGATHERGRSASTETTNSLLRTVARRPT